MIKNSANTALMIFLALYFAILLCFAPINVLSFDTYYYWDWSRHLALSYYDGSPMIAYFIRLSTSLFGNNLFALSFVGIIVTAITSMIIYKTARFFLSRQASAIAMMSWLFSPLVTLDLLKQTTYDTPLTLFWALTLYFTVRWIQTHTIKDLYFIGVSAGLMMLSKYTGILLILALLFFLLFNSYRSLFKTKHFYGAICLALLIFSPVLLWNYQHHWQSFIYQLSTHRLDPTVNPFYAIIKAFFTLFVPFLNIMLIPPFLAKSSEEKVLYVSSVWDSETKFVEKQALIVSLCRIICITILCFYLYAASKTAIRSFWLTPYLISSALLFGYYSTRSYYRKLAYSLIILYALISLCILVDNTSKYNFIQSKKFIFYHLIQKFNSTHPQLPSTVLSSGWFDARMLFFLKNKPIIYTLDCGAAENQYTLWSTGIKKKIADKTLKEAVFIDRHDRLSCLNKYFEHCKPIPSDTYFFRHKKYALYAYKCQN